MRLANSSSLTSTFEFKHCFAFTSRRRTQYGISLYAANIFEGKDTMDTRRKTDKLVRMRGCFNSFNENCQTFIHLMANSRSTQTWRPFVGDFVEIYSTYAQ
ncbi:hypothetical protein AVEN_226853-1 [Araneus ventricosus]|uniref:Uncharacterized protein n=1 Tax=Araneus ventricosus TaxID=182803 RepID=A0A4Y2EYV9_ARAVE|nr:hypothetical protein AVEN_226853-1 [Araneus ventricosus]